MNNLIKKYVWSGILLGVLLILAGVCTILFSFISKDQVNIALSIVTAVILFIVGFFYVVAGCMETLNHFFSSIFLYGSVYIAIGVILLLNSTIVPTVLSYALIIILLTLGVIYLARGTIGVINRMVAKWCILCYLFGVLGVALGVLAIIFIEYLITPIYITVGALIVLAGIYQIINTRRL